MTNEELNTMVKNHLNAIEREIKTIKDLSHENKKSYLVAMLVDAEECLVKVYRSIER